MIKGVNKKIVEINNPKSLYFEKAILYVRPNMSGMPTKLLSREAHNYLKSIIPDEKRKWGTLKIILVSMAIFAGISLLCFLTTLITR